MRTHWRRQAHITAVTLTFLALCLPPAPASAQDSSTVRINEVESSDGSPGDWVELVNTGTASADLSGWVVKDNDDSHSYTISSGTSLAPGSFLALDVDPSFGLGSSDSARLFQADGATLVDSYTWTDHATTTAPTKGAANACGGGGQPAHGPWPGDSAVTTADGSNVFGENLSGLSFESPSVLWAVDNGPSKLYRLVPNGATWSPDTAGGWSSGKSLHYAGGNGDPDTEGVVVTSDGMFAATERDNDNGSTSLPEILRFDASSTASSLNGTIYAYALNLSSGGFTRIATITSGFPGVMDLEFEPDRTPVGGL